MVSPRVRTGFAAGIFVEAFDHIAGAFHGKARADLARITNRAVFPVAEIERTKRAVAALRGAVADNDEFLPKGAFDLQP